MCAVAVLVTATVLYVLCVNVALGRTLDKPAAYGHHGEMLVPTASDVFEAPTVSVRALEYALRILPGVRRAVVKEDPKRWVLEVQVEGGDPQQVTDRVSLFTPNGVKARIERHQAPWWWRVIDWWWRWR